MFRIWGSVVTAPLKMAPGALLRHCDVPLASSWLKENERSCPSVCCKENNRFLSLSLSLFPPASCLVMKLEEGKEQSLVSAFCVVSNSLCSSWPEWEGEERPPFIPSPASCEPWCCAPPPALVTCVLRNHRPCQENVTCRHSFCSVIAKTVCRIICGPAAKGPWRGGESCPASLTRGLS